MTVATIFETCRDIWAANKDSLAADASRPDTLEVFRSSYPLHPEMPPHDPALDRADLEIRRRKLFKQRAESR